MLTGRIIQAGLITALALPLAAGTQMGPPEHRTDRPGEDLRNFTASRWQECSSSCASQKECWAYTFVAGRGGGTCWLKDGVPPARPHNIAVSGVKVMGPIEHGLDRPGEDLRSGAPSERPEETHSNTGNKKVKLTTSQATRAVQRHPVKPTETKLQFKSKILIAPRIESFFAIPGGPLKPGTRLFLNGQVFGTQPGKILMYGNFPNSPIELHDIKWVGDKKVNGLVPMFMSGQVNQKVSIRVQRSSGVLSEAREMNFVGRLEHTCEGTSIYGSDGSEKNCTPYTCYSDNIGVHCHEKCDNTAECDVTAKFHCNSASKCVDKH